MRVTLEDVCEKGASNLKQSDVVSMTGEYPIYGAAGYLGNVDFYHQEKPYVAIVKDGAGIGRTTLHPAKSSVIGTMQYLLPKDNVLPEYLYYVVRHMHLEKYFTGATIPHIYFRDYKNEKFNLDSLDKQAKIVEILGNAELVILKRRQQLAELDKLIKARFVDMFGDSEFNMMQWPTKKLSELCAVSSSKRIYQNEQSTEGVPFLRISDLNERIDNVKNAPELFIPINKYNELKENGLVPTEGDILVTSRGTLGRCYIVRPEDEFYFQDGMISWLSDLNSQITSVYLSQLFAMSGIQKQIASLQAGSTVAYLSIAMLKKLNIMLPPLDLQEQFAAFVEQTDKSKVVVQKALDEAQTLFDSLMQEYFG